MPTEENRTEAIAGEITRYLAQHSGCADTFDGISRWWISRIRFDEALQDVREALDKLLSRGVVEEQRLADGTVLYRSAIH